MSCKDCTQKDCSTCASKKLETNEMSSIKKIIAVASGKGGVGKSFVAGNLAVQMNRLGYKVGILDADITGPSVPKMFGIDDLALSDGKYIFPQTSRDGIKIISINVLLEDKTSAVAWRGSLISNCVKQFFTDVAWGDLDFLFIDMPPGTGDVSLTVFQSIPLDGIITVTSPQSLVGDVVAKAINLAKTMDIPTLGIVENMSYVLCPDCTKKIYIYGESRLQKVAEKFSLPVLGQIPIISTYTGLIDDGLIEDIDEKHLSGAINLLSSLHKED